MAKAVTQSKKDHIYAEVVLRSQTGASIIHDSVRLTANNLDMFRAGIDTPEEVASGLERIGFTIIASTRFGISISGPKELYEDFFKTRVIERPIKMFFGGGQEIQAPQFFMEDTPTIPGDFSTLAESVYIPRRGYFLAGEGAMPTPSYYSLFPPADISRVTNADGAHSRGFRGTGVKVAMVDSGFIENHDYYAGRGYNITVHAAVGSVNQDEYGHGTGIASNLLAIAPNCDFHFYKMSDGIQWASLAAFRMAVQDGVKVITNSWGQWRDPVLEAEITDAVAHGITVIFACGNGGPVGWPGCMPEVISVGGAFPNQDGTWTASSYASSGINVIYPDRHCPDFCGIVGQAPKGIFIVMPTMSGAQFDNAFSDSHFPNGDETGPSDGWLVASGTSSAAPMVAGAAVLLLEAKSSLTPAEIKQTLADTCIDVLSGSSASGEAAGIGPDSATGTGRLDIAAAVNRVAPLKCPTAPITCYRGPIDYRCPVPIICYRAPTQLCPPAPFQCLRAPFICRNAPIISCLRAPTMVRCPPSPAPVDPRERIINPERVREVPETAPGRLVPVVVMVSETELETWIALEEAYAAYEALGMSEEYSNFPNVQGRVKGPFNPTAT